MPNEWLLKLNEAALSQIKRVLMPNARLRKLDAWWRKLNEGPFS
jgi:hypothetical protein